MADRNFRSSQDYVDIDDLETQMQEVLRNDPPPRDASTALARISVTPEEIGRLSAEAVMAQFEQASQAVEGLGGEVKDSAHKLEAAMQQHMADLKLLTDAANKIREKGKAIQKLIEEASALSRKIHDACADFNGKVDGT